MEARSSTIFRSLRTLPTGGSSQLDAPSVIDRQAAWLKPTPPYLPKLSEPARLLSVVEGIKGEVHYCVDAALEHLFCQRPNLRELAPKLLWRLALDAQRYGAIYFLDRRNARASSDLAHDYADALDAIGRELTAGGLSNRLFNFAVCEWIHRKPSRRNDSPIRLPRNAIMSAGSNSVFVNRPDFESMAPADAFAIGDALYDLHDFVHYACASICGELYGCKYFGTFTRLDKEMQSLIRDHRFTDSNPTIFGDGLMFRQLSLGLFDALDPVIDTDVRLVDAISSKLTRYLRAEVGLLQPATGQIIRAPCPLDVHALMVLSQNKAYEHTASECEEHVFIRTGSSADLDPFVTFSTSERILLMADLPLQYNERRNYLRHRAHKRAYLLYAIQMRDAAPDGGSEAALLDMTINNLVFADYLTGHRITLFDEIQTTKPAVAGVNQNGDSD